MKKLLLTISILTACATDRPAPTTNTSRGRAYACSTRAVCNEVHLYEPYVALNTHRLCAAPSDADLVIAGDAAADSWESAWLADCELNQGREIEYSPADTAHEPLTCHATGECRADCEPLFADCDF